MSRAQADLLPLAEQTTFLRACLLGGESGAAAWAEWSHRNPDPIAGLPATTGEIALLMPLLGHGLDAAGVELGGGEFAATLGAATLREQRRAAVLHKGASAAIEALQESGIDVTVVGGVELAERAWPSFDLRHTHDLDLLIDESEMPRAVEALKALGGTGPSQPGSRGDLELTHLEGAPVFLHTNLFLSRGPRAPLAEILAGRAQGKVREVEVSVLAPDDALLHAIGQGLCARPGTIKWAPDAWLAAGAGPIDWDRLTATAERSRLALILDTGLSYLTDDLGLEVPAGALDRLAKLAEHPSGAERDIAALASMRARKRRGQPADRHSLPRTGLALGRRAPAYLRERLSGGRP